MRWKVNGVDRETGDERQIWLDAVSSEDATLLAGNRNMVVASAVEDMPVFKVVSQMAAGPIEIVLTNRQLKTLKVTEMKIASGVFLGLLFWSIFAFLVMLLFWGVVAAGIAGAASNM